MIYPIHINRLPNNIWRWSTEFKGERYLRSLTIRAKATTEEAQRIQKCGLECCLNTLAALDLLGDEVMTNGRFDEAKAGARMNEWSQHKIDYEIIFD